MSSNTRKRNREESSPKKSLLPEGVSPEGVSPEELKSVTKTKGLEKYITPFNISNADFHDIKNN
jgi:hypothetical protein